MSKTTIKTFNVNWLNIKNACRNTISMKDSNIEPTSEWKRKLLICRHSPIRKGIITWKWEKIPYAISTHFARHKHAEMWISSQRDDRVKDGKLRKDKSQMAMVSMEMEANIEEIQNISERRLCLQADKTTREYWEDFLNELKEYDEDIVWASVPQCVAHGGCCEPFSDCKYYDNLMKDSPEEVQKDLIKRYNYYNEKVRK